MVVVLRRLKGIRSEKKTALFSWCILRRVAVVAVPSILQQSCISFGNIIIQSVINGFGASIIAGYSAAVKLNNLVITSFTTLVNDISNYTAQNLGAKKPERVLQGFCAGIKLVWLLSLPLFVAYFFISERLLCLFMEDPSAMALHTGTMFLRILFPFYFVISVKLVADGILRRAGRMTQFMIATFTDLVLRIVFAVILSKTPLGATGIWCAWPLGWTVATVLSILFYRAMKLLGEGTALSKGTKKTLRFAESQAEWALM